jgi:hypothetical protein
LTRNARSSFEKVKKQNKGQKQPIYVLYSIIKRIKPEDYKEKIKPFMKVDNRSKFENGKFTIEDWKSGKAETYQDHLKTLGKFIGIYQGGYIVKHRQNNFEVLNRTDFNNK